MEHQVTPPELTQRRRDAERACRGLGALLCLCAVLWLALAAFGGDISTSHTFANGETVTADSMNNIVGQAVIGTSFYTTKTVAQVINPADSLLFYSSGLSSYRTISFTNFGTNLLYAGPWNLLQTPTNRPYWTYTNHPVVPLWDGTNVYWTYVMVQDLLQGVTNVYPGYTTPAFNFTFGFVTNIAHGLSNTPTLMRWVLTCTSAEVQNGFNVGDEMDVGGVTLLRTNSTGIYLTTPAFSSGANSSNVWIHCATNSDAQFPNAYAAVGTNALGNSVRLTNTNWKLKGYAKYFP